jgi:hypothetical protein
MKSLLLYCSLFLFIACNDHTPDTTTIKTPEKHDSSVIKPKTQNPYSAIDVSPLDISYYPTDYPLLKMTGKTNELPVARIIYGRPHRQGRKIFGNLLKYGEPWRMGANEATEVEFFKAVTIQNKRIPKGRYVLYCIPEQGQWTIIFNTNLYSWGLKQDASKDAYRFTTRTLQSNASIEYFTIVFEKGTTANETVLLMTWDDVLVRLPINF